MCGRFALCISPALLAQLFGLPHVPLFEPRYNIAPTQQALVIRCGEDGRRRIDPLKWGLIPSWARDSKLGSRMINARCETVREKPAFRHPLRYRRCIVPASGFYEWMPVGDSKQPYYIHPADGSPLCFAGIWDAWKSPDGTRLESFAILTTRSNSLLEPIHDRMPVLLHPSGYDLWLDRNMHDPERLQELYHPFPSELLTSHRVAELVNNPRFDAPPCIAQA